MAPKFIEKIKNMASGRIPPMPSISHLFPMRSFLITLAALILALIIGVSLHQIFFVEHTPQSPISGKVIAIAEMPKQIQDEPIKTVPDPEQHEDPAPIENAHALTPSETTEQPTDEGHKAVEEKASEVEDFIEGLVENTPQGQLPIIRKSDGLKPFDAYKVPFKLKPDTKGVISLVLYDYGLSTKLAKAAFETMPMYANFIASPYSDNLQAKVIAVRKKGIEVWMGIPMEGARNTGKDSLGPDTILAGLTHKENISRANTHLGRATGYAGIAFNADPPFIDGSPDLQTLINSLASRGLGITQLDTQDHLIDAAASQASTPYIGVDFWADAAPNKSAILAALTKAETMALNNGNAVIAFNPSQLNFSLISEWYKSLEAKHIQLAPLSYAINIAKASPTKKSETSHDTKSEH